MTLSVFLPVYCEERNIEKAARSVLKVLYEMKLADFELIIIDDGSEDSTAEIADRLAAEDEKVRVIRHPGNLGYGAALRTGYKEARMEYVFYTDGDNQYEMEDLKKFVALLPYTDAVVGFRADKKYSAGRRASSVLYNMTIRALYRMMERDIDCAFKVYPRELFNRIELESRGFFIDAEVAIKAKLLGYRVTEMSVMHYPRTEGESTVVRAAPILELIKDTFLFYPRYRKLLKK